MSNREAFMLLIGLIVGANAGFVLTVEVLTRWGRRKWVEYIVVEVDASDGTELSRHPLASTNGVGAWN